MIFKEKYTLSITYLLPLVAKANQEWFMGRQKYIPLSMIKTFVNGYSGDINKPWLDNHLFLLFESEYDKDFNPSTLRERSTFHSSYGYRIDKKFYTVFVFNLPKEYNDIYKDIKESKFDLIPRGLKKSIIEFWLYNQRYALIEMMYPDKNPKRGTNALSKEIIKEHDDLNVLFQD